MFWTHTQNFIFIYQEVIFMAVRNPSKWTGLERAVHQANLGIAARGDKGPNGEDYFHIAANKRDGSQEVHTVVMQNGRMDIYRYENGNRIKVDENWDMTPAEIKRRDYNRAYYQKKKAAKQAAECPNLIGAGLDLGIKAAFGIIDGIWKMFK